MELEIFECTEEAAKKFLGPLFRKISTSIHSNSETNHVRVDLDEEAGLKLYGLITQAHRRIDALVTESFPAVSHVDIYIPQNNRIDLIPRLK